MILIVNLIGFVIYEESDEKKNFRLHLFNGKSQNNILQDFCHKIRDHLQKREGKEEKLIFHAPRKKKKVNIRLCSYIIRFAIRNCLIFLHKNEKNVWQIKCNKMLFSVNLKSLWGARLRSFFLLNLRWKRY